MPHIYVSYTYIGQQLQHRSAESLLRSRVQHAPVLRAGCRVRDARRVQELQEEQGAGEAEAVLGYRHASGVRHLLGHRRHPERRERQVFERAADLDVRRG